MKIAIAQQDGNITPQLTDCREFLVLDIAPDRTPLSKSLVPVGGNSIGLLTFAGKEQIDVLICGEMGIASRNALESLGVILIPGASGDTATAVADFLCGALKGDQTFLDAQREDDPDDPMNCMHDCARCGGCGPVAVPQDLPNMPKI